MNKREELRTAQNIVRDILETNPDTRNSDTALYLKVCEKVNPKALDKPFWVVLGSLKELGLPNFETVRRTRQKLQAAFPELCGYTNVEAERVLNEEAFREYALEV